jgi:hypothetical protein
MVKGNCNVQLLPDAVEAEYVCKYKTKDEHSSNYYQNILDFAIDNMDMTVRQFLMKLLNKTLANRDWSS